MRANVGSPQHRVRILTELYLRAYWRYYAIAMTWAFCTVLAWPWTR